MYFICNIDVLPLLTFLFNIVPFRRLRISVWVVSSMFRDNIAPKTPHSRRPEEHDLLRT